MCVVVFVYSVMLSWFVSDETADAALRKETTVTAQNIQRGTSTAAALDDNVCLRTIRQYCDVAGWSAMQDVVQDVRWDAVWYCAACSTTIDDDDSVVCESCLQWHHFRCVALKTTPKVKCWFCARCKRV